MKKAYLKEGQKLRYQDFEFVFDGADIILQYARDQIFALGDTGMEFRFDGKDMCLDCWTSGTLARASDGAPIMSDSMSYYAVCYGDETGLCQSCEHADTCAKPPPIICGERYNTQTKLLPVKVTIDKEYPCYCSDCGHLKFAEGDDIPVCPIFDTMLAVTDKMEHVIRCEECMDTFPAEKPE